MLKKYLNRLSQLDFISSDMPSKEKYSTSTCNVVENDDSTELIKPVTKKLSEFEIIKALKDKNSSPEFQITDDEIINDNNPDFFDMTEWNTAKKNWFSQNIGNNTINLKPKVIIYPGWEISIKNNESNKLISQPLFLFLFKDALTEAQYIIENLQKEHQKPIRDI